MLVSEWPARAQDYPEHRLQFFSLLRAITNACFATLFAMSPAQLRLVIDSIVWAFRHTERNVADTGLCLLLELLTMFERSDFATQFHQTYYLQLVQEIFAVMTGALPWVFGVSWQNLGHTVGFVFFKCGATYVGLHRYSCSLLPSSCQLAAGQEQDTGQHVLVDMLYQTQGGCMQRVLLVPC